MTSTSHPLAWTEAPAAALAAPIAAAAGEAAQINVFPSLAEARSDWVDLQAAACASPLPVFRLRRGVVRNYWSGFRH
jgi:hypothetical protein